MIRRFVQLAAIAALTFPLARRASAQPSPIIQVHELSLDAALEAARAALADCRRQGFVISVVVVNRAGMPIVLLRDDEAAPHTADAARRKAFTARTWNMTTTEFIQKMAGNPRWQQASTLPDMIGIPGGLPIRSDGWVVGGIGVSGSPGKDDACALAGLAAAKLKQDVLTCPTLFCHLRRGSHAGARVADAIWIRIEVVRTPDNEFGFTVIPRRWAIKHVVA